MKIHARFNSLVPMAVVAALALGLSACKKPPEAPTPSPEPKAAADTEVTQSDSGTTTTFAPPAQAPQETASTPAQ